MAVKKKKKEAPAFKIPDEVGLKFVLRAHPKATLVYTQNSVYLGSGICSRWMTVSHARSHGYIARKPIKK